VAYAIHETPQNPNSPVVVEMELFLEPYSVDGDSVGWRVCEVAITHYGAGETTETWADAAPSVNSTDGLWWVQHADITSPEAAEFGTLPIVSGVADPTDDGTVDLVYALGCSGSVGSTPYEITTEGTYNFSREDEIEVISVGKDDPVELTPDI
jgi:hypothetical protein